MDDEDPHIRTIADLLTELGGVPLDRILMEPLPGTATEADVSRYLAAPRKRICELIDGTLVEKPPGFRESILAGTLLVWLRKASQDLQLGLTLGPTVGYRLSQTTIRMPDISFVTWDRLPGRRIPKEEFPKLCPNFASDFFKPANTEAECEKKRKDYFTADVEEYWRIDAERRTIAVYRSEDTGVVYSNDDVIQPGGTLARHPFNVHNLFDELDRHG